MTSQPTTPLTPEREQEIRTLDLALLMEDRPAAVVCGHLVVLLDEIDRLRVALPANRAQAWRDIADRADPAKPEISWFGEWGHQVGEWIRKQAEYEERAAVAAVETGE